MFNSNCSSILSRFRDTSVYWSKNREFFTPNLYFGRGLIHRRLECRGYQVMKGWLCSVLRPRQHGISHTGDGFR